MHTLLMDTVCTNTLTLTLQQFFNLNKSFILFKVRVGFIWLSVAITSFKKNSKSYIREWGRKSVNVTKHNTNEMCYIRISPLSYLPESRQIYLSLQASLRFLGFLSFRPLPLRDRQLAVFLPALSLYHQPADRKRELVCERASEGVTFRTLSYTLTHAQVLALPVWARWERQIIEPDKMRNAAQRGNSILEEM